MSQLLSLTTALPEYQSSRAEVLGAVDVWLRKEPRLCETLKTLVQNSAVEYRHTAAPAISLATPKSLKARNDLYITTSQELALKVASAALTEAGLEANEIDAVIVTSCTGYSLPGLDVYLTKALKLRPNVRRLPFLQLGCSGGVRALAVAHDYLLAHPKQRALVVSVELCSLTFQAEDFSLANLVSTAIFSDGAAGCVLSGIETTPKHNLCRILDTESYLFPESESLMGFELKDSGFHIVLDKQIPQFIGLHAGEQLWNYLKKRGVSPDFAAIHPGGRSVLEVLEANCAVPRHLLEPSWSVFKKYGNMSSATVLFILKEVLSGNAAGEGVAAAFGPGFCLELLHLQKTA